jgi:uncharacterized tellurite resistance protein B-like protein
MLDAIKRVLAGQVGPRRPTAAEESDDQRVRIAACALLLEIAHADGEFSTEERRHIEEALTRHFDLAPEAARELMAHAADQRREAVDLHQFTSFITKHYDEGQRMTLAEVLWRVVYADGRLSEHEDYLMQKLARLLDLRPGYLNIARARALPEREMNGP